MNSKIINYQDGLYRFMNSESMYLSFLKDFIKDNTFLNAKNAFEQKDYTNTLNMVHTLKGVAANLSLISLSAICNECLIFMRQTKEIISDEQFNSIEIAYNEAIEELKKITSGGNA